MPSVLSGVRPGALRLDPYPYVVVPDCLPADLYAELEASFPAPPRFPGPEAELRDAKYSLGAHHLLAGHDLGPWPRFARRHLGAEFWQDVLSAFGPSLEHEHPRFWQALGSTPATATVAVRDADAKKAANRATDLVADFQLAVDYTFGGRRTRGPHVDSPYEVMAALLYMRDAGDDTTGGELHVCRARRPEQLFPRPGALRICERPAEVADDDVEVVESVPYGRNVLIAFLNSPRALHAVAPRSPTRLPRRHVNVIVESYRHGPLFEIDKPPARSRGGLTAGLRRLLRR